MGQYHIKTCYIFEIVMKLTLIFTNIVLSYRLHKLGSYLIPTNWHRKICYLKLTKITKLTK